VVSIEDTKAAPQIKQHPNVLASYAGDHLVRIYPSRMIRKNCAGGGFSLFQKNWGFSLDQRGTSTRKTLMQACIGHKEHSGWRSTASTQMFICNGAGPWFVLNSFYFIL
jgi:hypothetical protein